MLGQANGKPLLLPRSLMDDVGIGSVLIIAIPLRAKTGPAVCDQCMSL
jgi:hypothetical protein